MSLHMVRSSRGHATVKVTCDDCGASVEVSCRLSNGAAKGGRSFGLREVVQSSLVNGMKTEGFAVIGRHHLCLSCNGIRKEKPEAPKKEETAMTAETKVTAAPAVSRDMETQIIVALSAAYDQKGKRYRGDETDASIAALIGDGCRPGWVAAVREERFGPEGSEAGDRIIEQIDALKDAFDREMKTLRDEIAKAFDALGKQAIEDAGKVSERFYSDLQKLRVSANALSSKADKRIRG